MRLRLEDNGSPTPITFDRSPRGRRGGRGNKMRLRGPRGDGRTIAIYNPETGMGTVLNDGVELGGLFKNLKNKIKAKKELRKKKQAVKQEQKLARYTNRQEAKTARQAGRQERKMTRIKGKQDVIQSRFDKKINKQGEREREFQRDTMLPTPQEGSDVLPEEMYEDTQGGNYTANAQEGDYGDEPYDEYEEVYDDLDGENGDPYEEMPEYGDYEGSYLEDGVPMNGWIDTVFKAGKSIVNKIAGSEAGKAVQQSVINKADYDKLKSEASLLRKQIEDVKKENLMWGGGGFVAGTLTGVLIGRATKR